MGRSSSPIAGGPGTLGGGPGTIADNGHRHVLEGDIQGRVRLVNSHLNPLNTREGEHGVTNALSKSFNQAHRFTLDNGDNGPGHAAVVDGVVQGVGDSSNSGTTRPQLEDDIDSEELPLLPFKGEET